MIVQHNSQTLYENRHVVHMIRKGTPYMYPMSLCGLVVSSGAYPATFHKEHVTCAQCLKLIAMKEEPIKSLTSDEEQERSDAVRKNYKDILTIRSDEEQETVDAMYSLINTANK